MKNYILKISILAVMMTLLITPSAMAKSSMVEGTIQGFTCLTHGKVCPVDRFDPHLTVEQNFVLVDMEKGYHFLPNLDRSILARNIHQKARVTGHVDPKYNSVEVEKFEVMKKGSWEEIWS